MMHKLLLRVLALLLLASPAAAQNYNATAGSGLTFGAKLVSGVLYPQWVMCDPTTPTQCVAVNASGLISINNISGTVSLPTGAATAANQATEITSLSTIATNTGAAIPSGTNIIGKVGVDQTTPGTTNAVSATNFPAAVSTGTGAQGASSPRVTVATDTATIAGSAPGTAGTASTNVLTVQGVASMTKLLVTPDSVALPANQSVNVAQFGGISTSTGQVAVSTAPVTATNTALVVDLRPDSPGIITLGPAADTSAVPQVLTPTGNANSGITPIVGGSAVSSLVLKASAGSLYNAYAECTAACWLMVFNSTTAPSNGATTAGTASGNLVECVPIASGGTGSINYNPGPPEVFSVGITAAISSTTCGTLTLATTGFIHGMIK